MTTGDQARALLAMIICGAGAGAVHDLFFMIRRGMLLTMLADFLLGLFLAASVAAAGMMLACDPFRLYAFVGVIMGWMIYALTLGTIVRILTQTIGKLSKKVTN